MTSQSQQTHSPFPDASIHFDRTWFEYVPTGRQPQISLREFLLQAVAYVFEVDVEKLTGPTRGNASIARARQVLMYLAHVGCGLTQTEVGRMFQRDRTTVAHACHVVEECREDLEFDHAVELLEQTVQMVGTSIQTRCAA
ncbi:MAG: helix-turn-helix domain-containing protein [Pseudomonadota bacterium]